MFCFTTGVIVLCYLNSCLIVTINLRFNLCFSCFAITTLHYGGPLGFFVFGETMIDLKLLEKKADAEKSYYDDYKQSLVNRGANTAVLEQIVDLNVKRKEMMTGAETAKAHQNKLSGEVGKLKREGKDAASLLSELDALKSKVKEKAGEFHFE